MAKKRDLRRRKPPKGFKMHQVDCMFKGVDRDVRDGFKAYCARRGISMKQRIEELMRQDAMEDITRLKRAQDIRRPAR